MEGLFTQDVLSLKKIRTRPDIMIHFDQWLGFLLIMTLLVIGFWIMFFVVSLLPYWIYGALKNPVKKKEDLEQYQEEQ